MSVPMFKMVNGVSVQLSDAEVAERLAEEREYAANLPAALAKYARDERDRKLQSQVDPLISNPLRWAGLSAEKQSEWTAYRQALLDVPQQAGFPHNVVWPVKPE